MDTVPQPLIDHESLAWTAQVTAASYLLKAMASPHRLMLLCTLGKGERSVGDLAQTVGLRQATVSQHLARLRLERLVETRRAARTVYYRLAEGPAAAVIQVLHHFYCRGAEAPPHP